MNDNFFVDAEWLYNEMTINKQLVILDIPKSGKEYIKNEDILTRKYDDYHIPGAIHITKEEVESKENDFNIYDVKTIENVFLSKGIDNNTTLVVYSDGHTAAGRIAFIAYWLGVKQVKILKGDIDSWKDSGYEFEEKINIPIPKETFGCPVPGRPEVLISTPEDVLEYQNKEKNFILASVRPWEEYIGKKSGYPYIEAKGSPLNALYAKSSKSRTDTAYLTENYNLDDVLESWTKWGITKDKTVAFFCGQGWRATIPFFLAIENGWEHVKLYDGGWYQWSLYHERDPDRYKIQQGNPRLDNYLLASI